MPLPAHVVRRAVARRLLRAGLVAGALYDLVFAGVMLAAPEIPAQWLTLPLPGEPFYLCVLAVLLAMAAAFYLLAAWDPERYAGIIAIAIAGRTAGALAFACAATGRPDLQGLSTLAIADGAFAALHAITLASARSGAHA